jgi:uncharacterized membrane protein YukC
MKAVKTFNDAEYWGFSKAHGFVNSNGGLSDADKQEIENSLEQEGVYIPANLSTPLSEEWVDRFIKGIGINQDSDKNDDDKGQEEEDDKDDSWRERRKKKKEDKDDEKGISTLGWIGIGVGGFAVLSLAIFLITRK